MIDTQRRQTGRLEVVIQREEEASWRRGSGMASRNRGMS